MNRKKISYWVLGLLVLLFALSYVFYEITHYTRSPSGDRVSDYERERLKTREEALKRMRYTPFQVK